MITPVPTLVADDSQTIRHIVVGHLNTAGFTDIDAVEDGNAALESLRHKRYGLLISDWEMPHLGGEELLKTVRQDPKYMKMPIIMITATASRGSSWLAGANAYLQKPFTEADFTKALRTVFGPR